MESIEDISVLARWFRPGQQHHGFRVGDAYTMDDRTFTSPHLLVMGDELIQEVPGGEGLDVLMVGNVSVSGLNQSKLVPVFNLLLGVELSDALQLGLGPSVSWAMPADESLHMLLTGGWVDSSGALDVPLNLFWIPDINNRDRIFATTDITF